MLQSINWSIIVTKVNYGDHYVRGKNGRIELKPNIEYTTPEGYTYLTDDLGRIINAEGILIEGEAERNTYAQSIAGREYRLPTDEGGHLIARIFKGSGDLDNLVPMDATLNRGEWKVMENGWKEALSNNKTVEVKIRPLYEGISHRPASFEIKFRIGNEKWVCRKFLNCMEISI